MQPGLRGSRQGHETAVTEREAMAPVLGPQKSIRKRDGAPPASSRAWRPLTIARQALLVERLVPLGGSGWV